MRLEPRAVVAELDGRSADRASIASGPIGLGDLVVTVELTSGRVVWSIANRADHAVDVRRVAVELAAETRGPLRMFRNGYQSWSPCDTAVVGVDRDPSAAAESFATFRGAHHADQRVAIDGEIRSEWVTVLADDASAVLLGAIGGSGHDVTFRARLGDGSRPVVTIEAYLGGARLAPGASRRLHEVHIETATPADVSTLLETWAALVGTAEHARTHAPYVVGWCSWYHYFDAVTVRDVAANLAIARDWPFEVFQVDDGYQRAIGDWLETNEAFPRGLPQLASDIAGNGFRPGIWLAPFLAAPDSRVAAEHPDWFARHASGRPLVAWVNPSWGGGADGRMWALDTTHPEVQAHLEHLGRELTATGFTYLKLDFTFAPSLNGTWQDAGATPAERVRAGYDAFRRGAGDDAFLLGCGVPLAHVVGVVDGNRIGQDVAPEWALAPDREAIPGYLATQPAVVHAVENTIARSFMHRRLWLNDPDCLMLRTEQTRLSPAAMRTWADVVATSGGMALVSDDLSLLDGEAKALLLDVIERGRASDARAIDGAAARSTDLMTSRGPTTLTSGPQHVRVPSAAPRPGSTPLPFRP